MEEIPSLIIAGAIKNIKIMRKTSACE